jgi:hypothetical protein
VYSPRTRSQVFLLAEAADKTSSSGTRKLPEFRPCLPATSEGACFRFLGYRRCRHSWRVTLEKAIANINIYISMGYMNRIRRETATRTTNGKRRLTSNYDYSDN